MSFCYSNSPDHEVFFFFFFNTESMHGLKNGSDCGYQDRPVQKQESRDHMFCFCFCFLNKELNRKMGLLHKMDKEMGLLHAHKQGGRINDISLDQGDKLVNFHRSILM